MEQQTISNVTLTQKEAEEYCAYKRQKKISEIMMAMRRTESALSINESAVKLCEQALRLRQAAVKISPIDLSNRGEVFFKSGVKLDCVIGGNGETFPSVKAYEAKVAVKAGAQELTLLLPPSHILSCRYAEIRREIKRVRKAAKKAVLKVCIDKVYPQATLERLARIAAEQGAQYFSVPYFTGCERLQIELCRGCLLEISNVDTLPIFKEMAGAGMGRILVKDGWRLYSQWLEEVEKITVSVEKVGALSLPNTDEVSIDKAKVSPLPLPSIKQPLLPATSQPTATEEGVKQPQEKEKTEEAS